MKRRSVLFIIAVLWVYVTPGCVTVQVDQEQIERIKTVGLLSVYIDKFDEGSPKNDAILQKAADYALMRYRSLLPTAHIWTITDLNLDNETFKRLTSLSSIESPYIGANGKPVVSYRLLRITKIPQKVVYKEAPNGSSYAATENAIPVYEFEEYMEAKREILNKISSICKEKELDAVIIVYIRSAQAAKEAGKAGDIQLGAKGRFIGMIKMNPAIMLLDSSGKIVLDFDEPRMDDLAPLVGGLPMYVTTNKSLQTGYVLKTTGGDLVLDLDDKGGKTLEGFKKLVDKTSAKTIEKLMKKLGK